MKLRIAFATGGLPFNGHTLKTKGLGGSETALIYMAKALADRGHDIDVFCQCDAPGRYDNVSYYHAPDIERHFLSTPYDVFIVSRWTPFLKVKGNVGLRVLWCHDTCGRSRSVAHSSTRSSHSRISAWHSASCSIFTKCPARSSTANVALG